MDENYITLIGLPERQFSHSGPQQASHIMELIRRFNIAGNIGFFTGDNAGSNDTCLKAISADEFTVD
jgi:predicted ATPase